MPEAIDPRSVLGWAVAELPLPGESESGDRAVVLGRADGVLLGVVDGLGHGHDASTAAAIAVDTIGERFDRDLQEILATCHSALQGTRGVALTLALITARDHCMRWLGVGNVEGVIVRRGGGLNEHALVVGGVVGYQIPPVKETAKVLEPGDLVVFATDGLHSRFSNDVSCEAELGPLAQSLLRDHATGKDDACVLVARYRPSTP